MASQSGRNFTGLEDLPLMKELQQYAPEYSAFYATYLCEMLTLKLYPDRDTERLEQSGLRFRPYENYSYPPRNIRSITTDGQEIELVINFLGLYGVNSPLPRCYHQEVAMQQNLHGVGEVPLQNFLDIFNNRFYWLYYQAWKKYRSYLHINEKSSNKTIQRIFSFIGLGPQQEQQRFPLSRFRLASLSGILSCRVRSKAGLLIILREFFSAIQFKLQEFVASMVRVDERPILGKNAAEKGFRLGDNGLVGQSVMDVMSRICIIIGPLDFQDYLEFVPGEKKACLLNHLMKLYLNDGLVYDVKLILKTERITNIPWNNSQIRLGQSCFLGKPKEKYKIIYYKYEAYL